jgi:hypothetical protein
LHIPSTLEAIERARDGDCEQDRSVEAKDAAARVD